MARGFPERAVDKLRRLHLDIAGGLDAAANIILDRAIERPAFGMPENAAGRLFLLMEKAELAPQAAMVALLRLFQLEEILFQLFVVRPGGAVNALQLRVARIAAPISARDLHQLERMAELARRGQMRPGAKIDEIALAIKADRLVLRDFVDPFGFVFLAQLGKERDRAIAFPFLARDLLVAIDDLVHAQLDLGEVFRRERRCARKVVIEASIGRRAESDLRLGIKLFHRLGHHMRGVVADNLERLGRVARQDRELGVLLDRPAEVFFRTIDLHRNRSLGEARTDGCRNLAPGGAAREMAHRAVGQGYRDLGVGVSGHCERFIRTAGSRQPHRGLMRRDHRGAGSRRRPVRAAESKPGRRRPNKAPSPGSRRRR